LSLRRMLACNDPHGTHAPFVHITSFTSSRRRLLKRIAASFAIAAFMTACAMPAHTPKPVSLSDTVEVTALIDAIDPANRLVRLRTADGRARVMQIGPAVQNFNQLKTGDRVSVRFTEGLAAEVVKPGTGVTSARPTYEAGRALPGAMPGASGTLTARGVVKVVAVDAATNTVEVLGGDGAVRKVRVQDPKAQAFARGLKAGDEVQLTFTEALAVSISPAP
jgi:hypothetical protein